MIYIPVDLGLPSGLLWAAENTPAADGGVLLSFKEANTPGTDLSHQARDSRWEVSGREAFEELRRFCTFSWDKERNGAVVTGPNGNTLLLPAAGWKLIDGTLTGERMAFYWSNITKGKDAVGFNFVLVEDNHERFIKVAIVSIQTNPKCGFCLRKIRRAPFVEDIEEEGNDLRDEIAEAHGHNVTYCESMDMDLISLICDCVNDEDYIDEVLDDLRFYASNGRALPEELAEASAEQFKEYFRKNRGAVLCAAQDVIDEYRSCDYPAEK